MAHCPIYQGTHIFKIKLSQDIITLRNCHILPHAQENHQTYERLKICLNLLQHGVSQTRPFGPEMASIYHTLSKTEVIEWSGPRGALGQMDQNHLCIVCLDP